MSDQDPQDLDARRKALEIEKLEAEIRQIRQSVENDQTRWRWEYTLKLAATVAAIVGSFLYLAVRDWFTSGG